MRALTSLELLAEAAEGEFTRRLGRPPRWVVAAPGRVNLIGEHTDYNDGLVLPMAIDRYVVIAADRPLASGASPARARVFSTAFGQWAEVAVEGPPSPDLPAWADYVQGVAAGFLTADLHPGPFEAVIHADLPVGGGLSSSAALEVAVATLLEALAGVQLDPLQKALLCQKAERHQGEVTRRVGTASHADLRREGADRPPQGGRRQPAKAFWASFREAWPTWRTSCAARARRSRCARRLTADLASDQVRRDQFARLGPTSGHDRPGDCDGHRIGA
jgi:hypothetical protein